MFLYKVKRYLHNCILSKLGIVHFICLFIADTGAIFAQDTIQLNGVEVVATKINWSGLGKITQPVDSAIKQLYRTNSLADLLATHSSVFIKNYGPGSISTTALRGGNASQTALLWNGFNIQNPMLGQSDLALLPVFLFDKVSVEYGGSSALWGSGAVGGSILLNNDLKFNKGVSTYMQVGAGSFGLVNASAAVEYSRKRFVSNTKMYGTGSENNFRYSYTQDGQSVTREQQHAGYLFRGVMQEFKYKINSRQILNFNAWLSANDRQLPAINSGTESRASQKDNVLRTSLSWNYLSNSYRSNTRTAYFLERINYTDSLVGLHSKNLSKNFILENEHFINYLPNHELHLGVNFNSSTAQSDNYVGQPRSNRISFLAGHRSGFFSSRLLLYAAIRVEFINESTIPVTGNVAAEYKLGPMLSIKTNVARVYRQPTLNELFWMPGGNRNLKPEEGEALDGSVCFDKVIKRYRVSVSGSAFSRWINNWILWVPVSGNTSSPLNLQEVWSRGTETRWKLNYSHNEFGYMLGVSTSYVLSTVSSSQQENNASVGKQLIYTPRYTGDAQAMLWYEKTSLSFFYTYTGYRFTSSDNSSWLDPYHLSSLKLNYNLDQKFWNIMVFISCNNLFNSTYTVVASRPMPLRNFELGITLQTNNPTN